MNALSASKGLPKETHKSINDFVKLEMYENEALECQDSIPTYMYVAQDAWRNKNEIGKQNFHHTQIPSDIEVCDGFAMNYYVALFFNLDEIIMP